MRSGTSERLRKNKNRIMQLWSERATHEIAAAKDQQKLALWDSLPEYLEHIADALSTTIERTTARKAFDQARLTRVGKEHGMQRSKTENYTVDQVIFEYHILR